MKTRQHFVDEYHAAMRAESELYERVKQDRGPGQPNYDPQLFQKWLEAVARTNATSKALREAFSELSSS